MSKARFIVLSRSSSYQNSYRGTSMSCNNQTYFWFAYLCRHIFVHLIIYCGNVFRLLRNDDKLPQSFLRVFFALNEDRFWFGIIRLLGPWDNVSSARLKWGHSARRPAELQLFFWYLQTETLSLINQLIVYKISMFNSYGPRFLPFFALLIFAHASAEPFLPETALPILARCSAASSCPSSPSWWWHISRRSASCPKPPCRFWHGARQFSSYPSPPYLLMLARCSFENKYGWTVALLYSDTLLYRL